MERWRLVAIVTISGILALTFIYAELLGILALVTAFVGAVSLTDA